LGQPVKNSGGNQGFRAVSQWERFPFGLARLTRRGKETPEGRIQFSQ
jgi:hypothetical protein